MKAHGRAGLRIQKMLWRYDGIVNLTPSRRRYYCIILCLDVFNCCEHRFTWCASHAVCKFVTCSRASWHPSAELHFVFPPSNFFFIFGSLHSNVQFAGRLTCERICRWAVIPSALVLAMAAAQRNTNFGRIPINPFALTSPVRPARIITFHRMCHGWRCSSIFSFTFFPVSACHALIHWSTRNQSQLSNVIENWI